MSSPSFYYPSTPSSSRNPLTFRPLSSSPLVDLDYDQVDARSSSPGSPKSSPILDVQARRKSNYKTLGRVPQTPTTGGRIASGQPTSMSSKAYRTRLFASGNPTTSTLDSQKAFIRERFRARCIERAANARDKAIKGKRSVSGQDDVMDLGNEEEDDEFLMQDELFRRIVRQTACKRQYAYQVSYDDEVGSSFDPDLEDVDEWEKELSKPISQAEILLSSKARASGPVASSSRGATSSAYRYSQSATTPSASRIQFDPSSYITPPSRRFRAVFSGPFAEPADPEFWNEAQETEEFIDPEALDDEELQAYAEEYAKLEAAEAFADIPEEELFDLQWFSENESMAGPGSQSQQSPRDDAMDIS